MVVPVGEIADALGISNLVVSAGGKALDAVAPGLSDALADGLAGTQDLLSSLTDKASQLASKIFGDGSELDALECGGNSFTAGTLVLTASGALVPISALHTGEKVAAGDTSTGKKKVETVDAVLVHYDADLYDLAVDTPEGKQDVQTTANHLIWDLTTHQWTQAAKLHNGDRLLAANDTTATAVGGTTPADTQGGMWDLTIDNLHDFYVVGGNVPVLVHNSACTVLPSPSVDQPIALGTIDDAKAAVDWPNREVLRLESWTIESNDEFIQGVIEKRQSAYLASSVNGDTLANSTYGESVYAREMNQLLNVGYNFSDDGFYLIPPSG